MVVPTDEVSTSSRNCDNENQNENSHSHSHPQEEYKNIHPEELLEAEYDMDLENIDLNLDLVKEEDSPPTATTTPAQNNNNNNQTIIANRQGGVFRVNNNRMDSSANNNNNGQSKNKKLSHHFRRSRSIPSSSYDYNHTPSSTNSSNGTRHSNNNHNDNHNNHDNRQLPPETEHPHIHHSSEDDDLDLDLATTTTTTTTATTTPLCESIVNLFRRVLPSSFSSTAWWLSVHTLGLCDMILLEVDGSDFSVTIANTHRHDHTYLKFGLWAYSDITFETYDDDFVMFYVNQWEQLHQKCIYPLKGGMYGDTPLFVIDSKFMLARICALLTTASGFICMMILWAAVVRESLFQNMKPFGWKTWVIGIQLLCCFFEAMTLFVLKSQMCNHDHTSGNADGDNGGDDDGFSTSYYYRNCEIDQGASIPILSCCFWFFAIIAMLTWPKDDEPQYSHTFLGFWSALATEHYHYSRGEGMMSMSTSSSTTTDNATSIIRHSRRQRHNGGDSPSSTRPPENEDLVLQTSHHDGLHDIVTYSSQSQLQHLDDDDEEEDDDDEGHHFT